MPWLIVILAYFLGSIPTAYIAGRVMKGIDIRQVGDANVGAANVFRQLGAKVGVAVGIVDAGGWGFRGCWLVTVLPCPAWWALPISSGQGRQQYVRPNHYRAEVK